jgi:hypothetical protein
MNSAEMRCTAPSLADKMGWAVKEAIATVGRGARPEIHGKRVLRGATFLHDFTTTRV